MFVLFSNSYGDERNSSLSSMRETLEVGNPYVIRLELSRSKFNPETNSSREKNKHYSNALIRHLDNEGDEEVQKIKLFPQNLEITDPNEQRYSNNFVLFYNLDKKKLIFQKEGIYEIVVKTNPDLYSNPIYVNVVSPSDNTKRALKYLKEPKHYVSIDQADFSQNEEAIKNLKIYEQIIEEDPNCLLSRWISAYVGISYFNEFQKEHASIENCRKLKKAGQFHDEYLEKAIFYLDFSSTLADDFPVKEEALYKLALARYINIDDDKVNSILNELSAKYPKSKYGKKAVEAKKELEILKNGELNQSTTTGGLCEIGK